MNGETDLRGFLCGTKCLGCESRCKTLQTLFITRDDSTLAIKIPFYNVRSFPLNLSSRIVSKTFIFINAGCHKEASNGRGRREEPADLGPIGTYRYILVARENSKSISNTVVYIHVVRNWHSSSVSLIAIIRSTMRKWEKAGKRDNAHT